MQDMCICMRDNFIQIHGRIYFQRLTSTCELHPISFGENILLPELKGVTYLHNTRRGEVTIFFLLRTHLYLSKTGYCVFNIVSHHHLKGWLLDDDL
jgi:hypothetical protein